MSPGVYVEEVPSAVKPISGVSTSTACFLGIVPDKISIPEENPDYDPTGKSKADPNKPEINPNKAFVTKTFEFYSDAELLARSAAVKKAKDDLANNQVAANTAGLVKALRQAEDAKQQAEWPAGNMEPMLITNFGQFKRRFGGFSNDGLGEKSGDLRGQPPTAGFQNRLAHAVYGFFDNGGARCYVMRFRSVDDLLEPSHLERLAAIDEISIVAAPGIVDKIVQQNIVDHCARLGNRFAILDPPEIPVSSPITEDVIRVAGNTDYGALYFPRIQVFDIAAQLSRPEIDDPAKADEVDKGEIWLGPSGHIAGIYSRVDHQRGVHKAPANEVVRGALELEFQISKGDQDGLNPGGVNCIRHINNNITVWGARTIGGDANTDLKYINVRRTLIFLRESIDRGTQWVVFEPNDRTLWAKITLNVSAFLTTVWRDGALFGSTPQEAFYVKCDDETNPVEERDLGRVTTEIGVAIVRPAEFVIFRISQWAGPQASK
jgi:phage tail sheath protein FI